MKQFSWSVGIAEQLCQQRENLKMNTEKTSELSKIFTLIESEYESSRTMSDDNVQQFFDEIMKFDNGSSALKEFTWLFGIGEKDRHIVEAKECRKVYLIDFKKCRKFLNTFIAEQS